MRKVIYDIGANKGDNLEYYLMKADRVVAVEANPTLADKIRERYKVEVENGSLKVENSVIVGAGNQGDVPFYIHKSNDYWSSFIKPKSSKIGSYEERSLPSIQLNQLVAKYGNPHYVKIDIEGYDHVILKELFKEGIYPDYLSVELQHPMIIPLLAITGGYKAFQVTEGFAVGLQYRKCVVQMLEGSKNYRFKLHSAGPYGNELRGPWRRLGFVQRMAGTFGGGWRDVHVSRLDKPESVPFRFWKESLKMTLLFIGCIPNLLAGLVEFIIVNLKKSR